MNEEETYISDLKQHYIDNAEQDELYAKLFVGVSYEVDCMLLSNPTPESICLEL